MIINLLSLLLLLIMFAIALYIAKRWFGEDNKEKKYKRWNKKSNAKSSSTGNKQIDPNAPTCPKCGSLMVERTSSIGEKAGQHFWGCSRYPKCRGKREISAVSKQEKVKSDFKLEKTVSTTPQNYSEDVPLCPSCGVPMLKLQCKQGNRMGLYFWGCPHYRQCGQKPINIITDTLHGKTSEEADHFVEVPECPKCGGRMTKNQCQNGPRSGQYFWRCRRAPECDGILNIAGK